MANKYSRFQLRPYESNYIDPGSVAVSGVLRKRYDDNRSSYDMLTRAANSINTLEGDRHIKENALKKVESDFQRTIEVGNFENAGRVVSDSTNDFIGNRGLQLAQQSYANRQQELKTIDQLRANGKQVLDFNQVRDTDPNSETFGQITGHRTDAHSSYYQDPNGGEMIENVYRSGSEMQLDYTQRMESLLAGIAKDGGGSKLGPAEIQGFLKYMKSSGVSRSKANRVVQAALEAYIDSDEGTQDYRRLTEIEGLSDDEAKIDMVNRLSAVAEKQIGSVTTPHYMQIPTSKNDSNSNSKGYITTNGSQVKKPDVKQYSSIVSDLRDKQTELNSYAPGTPEYETAVKEINVLKSKARNYTNQIETSYPALQESLNRGKEAMGKYSALENMFLNMTSDDTGAWWQSLFGAGFWGDTFSETHVRNMWKGDEAEIQNFVNLFDKEGALEHINKTNGTNYTKADLPGLKKAASKYINWMYTEGNETLDSINDLASLKQSDVIVFSQDNTKAMDNVNKALKQYSFEQFNFVFETDEERIAAKKAWEQNAMESGAEGKEDIIKFAGITVPSQGETGKIIIEMNGARHLATFKDGDQFSNFAYQIYQDMGSPEMAQNQYIAQRVESGDFTNAEYVNLKMEDIVKGIENGQDMTFQHEALRLVVDNGTRDMLGLSQQEWANLPEATKQKHREAFYGKQYEIR